MSSELDVAVQLIMVAGYPGSLIVVGAIGYKIWSSLNRLTKAYEVLNHNTSAITKALLAKGILSPEDVETVDV